MSKEVWIPSIQQSIRFVEQELQVCLGNALITCEVDSTGMTSCNPFTFTALQKNAAKHHLAHKGVEGSKFWGGSQNASKEIERVAAPSYLHSSCKKVEEKCLYDRIFHVKEGYVPKLSRDDRAARLKLQVCEEEKSRGVPLLSSSMYGRRKPLEAPTQQHSRVEVIKDFYRNRGTNIPPWD